MMALMTSPETTTIPTILFGAFDRHNFGDLLFPHIAEQLLEGKPLLFAGLAARDLRGEGGHQVRALAQVVAEWGGGPVNILHVGGELLTCDAWQAAVMLLPPHQAHEVIARLDAKPQQKMQWAQQQLGGDALAPYTLSRQLFPHAARVLFNAVGGVDLGRCDAALRAEVVAKLKAADLVSVRDRQTLAELEAAGVAATLLPDPAVMVAELFGPRIRQRTGEGELAALLAALPQGYLAVQFSADFGDDATLAAIAAQLDRVAVATGYGIVLFRAGAAPWHDELVCYQRLAARIKQARLKIFTSLNLWDICALIAHSRGYCGSSLHGRIVALAFALPRLNLRHPTQPGALTKQAAFATTWEQTNLPATVAVDEIAAAIEQALGVAAGELQETASGLAARYRQGFAALRQGLE
jgi:hypothetical protein